MSFLEGALEALHATHRSLSVLQCGANDGITVDPIHRFICAHPQTVRAVAVEPLPDVFDLLCKTHAGNPHVRPLNLAVGPRPEIELHRIKPEFTAGYKGIIATGITSFDRNHVLAKARKQLDLPGVLPEDRIETITVPSHTVSRIIDDHVDMLDDPLFVQIDAEGFDDEIIYSIDFSRHRPIAINFEAELLDASRMEALRTFLAGHGYRFIPWKKSDTLAIGDR